MLCGDQLFFNHHQGRCLTKEVKQHHVGFRLNASEEFLTVRIGKH